MVAAPPTSPPRSPDTLELGFTWAAFAADAAIMDRVRIGLARRWRRQSSSEPVSESPDR